MRDSFHPLNFLVFQFKTIPHLPSVRALPLSLGKGFETFDLINENFSVLASKSGTLRISDQTDDPRTQPRL